MAQEIYGTTLSSAVAATSAAAFTTPFNASLVYVSSDQILRVTLDVNTAPNATIGLIVPANATSVFPVYPGVANGFRVFNTSASVANVSVQFVGD